MVHKKEDKYFLKKYRPISLLLAFSKSFEKVVYNSLFHHFQSNKHFTPSQSSFYLVINILPNNSRLHMKNKQHLLTIQVLMPGVCFLISQNKVWHGGLLFKLQVYRAEGKLLVLLKDYLNNCKQRQVLNC